MDALLRLCPCCGQPIERELEARDLSAIPLPCNSSVARPLIELLGKAWPRAVSTAQLIEHAYATRPDGGPEYAVKSVHVTIMRLRRRLMRHGWTITDARRGGYRLERVG